jgi:murein DD-endopeptidase MepM/ murein hydrolase activator NlpD
VSELELARESREAYARELQAYQTQFALSIADPASASAERRLLKRFRNLELYMTQEAEGYGIYAQNDNVYSVTTRIQFLDADNFRFEGNGPYAVELGPGETRKVSVATPQRRHVPASFNISFKMMMGWVSARHDASATYRVPFETGRSVLVSQGFNGRVTHKGDSKYAVDFQVPVGTPVVAAREGTVAAVQSAHDKGGFDRSYGSFANYIVIEHPDRTYGQYAHLKKDGVMVRVGQKVKAGERIGYSGNTGYSSGPHLHFEVVKIDAGSGAKMVSVPIRFKSGGKLLDAPKPGDRFVAL